MKTRIIVLSFLMVGVFETCCFAYIDLGSGSYALQMALAGLVGAAFALRQTWGKALAWFKGEPTAKDDESLASGASGDGDNRRT